nr:TNF receptor-associated factor 6-like isoform X1 [Dermacentor andersoni]
MPDRGQGRVYRFRDHVAAGVNWRPTRFVDEVPSSRVCGLCRMIPKRTVVLPCGHALCQSCHAASLEGDVGQCPLDQVQFEEAECVGGEFPTRIANTVKVYCWNEAHGCEYTGTMDRMLEHYEKECTFHTVECLRCGEGVQHKDLPTHYAAGCPARVPSAITVSSEHTALTLADVNVALEDVKAMLGCLNHDQLLPVIQSQLNELTEQARNQEARLAGMTRELGACEHNLKAEMDQIAATISSTVAHQRTSQQNPSEEDSTSRSLSLHSGQDLILRKLEGLAHLENWRKTSQKPDFGRVIARCETLYSRLSHLTSALSTNAQIKGERLASYVLTLENYEEIIQWQGEGKKFAEIRKWHMRDTNFTIAVWKYGNTPTPALVLDIEFNGTLVDSQCWPPYWRVTPFWKVTSNQRSLTAGRKPCYCKRHDPSLPHFHLKFTADIASMENGGYLRDGMMAFHISLRNKAVDGSIAGAP